MTKPDVTITDELKKTTAEFAKAQQLYVLLKSIKKAKDLAEFEQTLEQMLEDAFAPKED